VYYLDKMGGAQYSYNPDYHATEVWPVLLADRYEGRRKEKVTHNRWV
jgi:hypothetical protein